MSYRKYINVKDLTDVRGLLNVAILTLTLILTGSAQTASPPDAAAGPEVLYNGYRVISSSEIGWRFRSVDGNENKYRSDLNYKAGFRTFDSSLFMESDTAKGKYFDSLLITNSGWGSDPSGYTRVNVEKTGYYRFNSQVRRIKYFNNLSSFLGLSDRNQHSHDTRNTMGDFDLTILPQNETIRFRVGASFGNRRGPGTWNMRWQGDEFKVDTFTRNRSTDLRFGVEGKLAGFDWNLLQGFREYRDRSEFTITGLNEGHAPPPGNITRVSEFFRLFPTNGRGHFTHFNLHRTFAKRLDFTGRILYSDTESVMSLAENVVGRNNTSGGQIFDSDIYRANSGAQRLQTRGDLGLTYAVTEAFRLSNTFTFDQFSVDGGSFYANEATGRNANGTPRTINPTQTAFYRVHNYRRFMNTIEGDYQFNRSVSFHLGYRYSERTVGSFGYIFNQLNAVNNPQLLCTGVTSPNPSIPVLWCQGDSENKTHTLLAGMRIKPINRWTIFWDLEHGAVDSVFSRPQNNDVTNFRLRSKYRVGGFSFDLAFITRDNSNPASIGETINVPAGFDPVSEIKTRTFSGNISWDPVNRVNLSGGYTYRRQDSNTPVYFPYQVCSTPACTAGTTIRALSSSQFFVRDHYGYVEVAARPHRVFGLFAAFRMNKDLGEGDRVGTLVPNAFPVTGIPFYSNWVEGYPMSFTSPEVKGTFRLTRNLDWNIGYQYYKYNDVKLPIQNYRAHLPYTSLRFYFGNGAADR